MSGLQGRNIDKLMKAIFEIERTWNVKIRTAKLNRWLDHTQGHHPPPAVSGRRLKLKYMTQIKSRPPGFMISCTRPEAVPESYTRYLVNSLRKDFDMPGIPLRVVYRSGDNPYASKDGKPKRASVMPKKSTRRTVSGKLAPKKRSG